jgi:hypothetical protein
MEKGDHCEAVFAELLLESAGISSSMGLAEHKVTSVRSISVRRLLIRKHMYSWLLAQYIWEFSSAKSTYI